jgi:CheY-like chemotaxis protein
MPEIAHPMTSATVTVLLVDDDIVDIMAVKRSFRDLKIANPVVEAHDGIEALEHLRGENGREKLKPPLLVLLDLNMPRMGGLEFLNELRSDPTLLSTLVFVMTTSGADGDRACAFSKNVAGYILKHRFGQTFVESVSMLQHYWRLVEFPD